MSFRREDIPFLGYGIGLRRPHWESIFHHRAQLDFVELLADNYLGRGGRVRQIVEQTRATFPAVLHSVGLSIGGPEPLDLEYIDRVAALAEALGARWWTDHLCWSNAFGVEYHDLIPLPLTQEAVDHVVERVRIVQARIGLPFGLENPSYYMRYAGEEMSEAGFIGAIAEGADCGLLLDVNNVYVNSVNHGFEARAFIEALPLERVMQIHLAGHEWVDDVIIDTHGAAMLDEVLELYAFTLGLTGPRTTLVEWDNSIPPLDVLLAENERVRARAQTALAIDSAPGASRA